MNEQDRDRLAELLDSVLPRMAFEMYGKFYTDDPEWSIDDYYRRVAEELLLAGVSLRQPVTVEP